MFFKIQEACILLYIRLTPKAHRDEIKDTFYTVDGKKAYLCVSLRAVPQKGQANRALLKFLSRVLEVEEAKISVHRGANARLKTLCISDPPLNLIKTLNIWKEKGG